MKFFIRHSLTFIFLAAFSHDLDAQHQIDWPERYYNPSPLDEDLVLPMPCNGAMVFRPVATPNTDGMMGDVRVMLGQESADVPFLNGLRRSYVSGGFQSGGDNPKGLFYMGKYEVADAQWQVVMGGECPKKKLRGRAFLPVVERTPLEMKQFAEAYTIWLMNKAPDALPTAADSIGFLRLPTEDEWEFAARGGLSVSESEFRGPLPPIPAGADISEYVAHGGTESAGGKVQVIGTLKGNPLGLFDILGNVGELVETPFALVRHGRLHGQSGGVVKRGGDARTSLSSITSATRFEVPPFSLKRKAPFADRFTGARLAIAALSIPSADAGNEMLADLDKLANVAETPVSTTEKEVDDILEQLETEVVSPRGQQQLAVVRDTIVASRAERNEQNLRSVRLLIETAPHVCDQIITRLYNADAIQEQLISIDLAEQEAQASGNQEDLELVPIVRRETQQKLSELQRNLGRDLNDFGDIVEELVQGNSFSELMTQTEFVAPNVEEGGPRRVACFNALEEALDERVTRGFTNFDSLETRMVAIYEDELAN